MPRILPALILLAGLGSALAAEETEKELKAEEVPAPVMATMVKAAAGAKLSEYEQETKDGKVLYTAEFTDAAGKEQEVTVAADGVLVSVKAEDADDHDDATK